jgi:hypothetical protein
MKIFNYTCYVWKISSLIIKNQFISFYIFVDSKFYPYV